MHKNSLNSTLTGCTFETLDAGGFYSSGQHGTAFTNRGNTLRANIFSKILNHAEGTGVQQASVQALYLDDQMSDWVVEQNTFLDCEVGTFTGGGRRNRVAGNTYARCGTAHYLNEQVGSNTASGTSEISSFGCGQSAIISARGLVDISKNQGFEASLRIPSHLPIQYWLHALG